MNELSQRLKLAVDFLKKTGYAKNDSDIARRLGVANATISMATKGNRTPTWELLLDFCDKYPINFWWIRTGKGSMVKEEREIVLLKRIEELEQKIQALEGR